jgi:hypothetical protein
VRFYRFGTFLRSALICCVDAIHGSIPESPPCDCYPLPTLIQLKVDSTRHSSGDRVYQALIAKGLTVVGLRLMDSVFGLLLLTTEPRSGGGATAGEGYVVVGIENLDC